jgi:hypothetical protein
MISSTIPMNCDLFKVLYHHTSEHLETFGPFTSSALQNTACSRRVTSAEFINLPQLWGWMLTIIRPHSATNFCIRRHFLTARVLAEMTLVVIGSPICSF